MGFLDNIGQRHPEPQTYTPEPVADRPFTWDAPSADGARAQDEPPRSNRVHAAVVWVGVLIVVSAVAVAAWMGARKLMTSTPRPQVAAKTTSETPDPATTPSPAAPRPARRAATRHGITGKNREPIETANTSPGPESTDLAFTAPADSAIETPGATASDAALIEASSDPVPAALVTVLTEDESVYSSDATDIVAPRLVSLGFPNRPLKGFQVRTSRLELIISKSGSVERARVSSTSGNWEDAMLLSRAKMFQFVPALRNGSPVRFRYVMDVAAAP
jgi:hypothetical protein